MHIFWVSTIFDDSAVSNILLQILPHLPENWKVTVVSLSPTIHIESKASNQLRAKKIDHISLNCKKTEILHAATKLEHLIVRHKPDIVHAQLGRAYIALLLASTRRHKYYKLATFHNNASYFNRITSFALKLLFQRFDAITAVSQCALTSIQNTFDIKKTIPAQVIYNPVASAHERKTFSDNKEYNGSSNIPILNDSKFILLASGRLVPGKGHELWIAMLPQLSKLLNNNFEIWCAGKGPLKSTIQSKVKALGFLSNLRMLGYAHNILDIMNKSDVVIFPSQNEGFGLVPCEALLNGTVTIAQDMKVMREILDDDIWLVDCKNPTKFAKKIFDMYSNKEKYNAHLISAQERIQEKFSVRTISSEYEKFYESMKKSSEESSGESPDNNLV